MKISNIKNTLLRRILLIVTYIPAAIIYFTNQETMKDLGFDIKRAW